MGLMDHIRKSMDPNFVSPEAKLEEAAKPKIKVAPPLTVEERIKASIEEAVDPKTKKKKVPVAPDLEPPVQKPDPDAGKPPPVQTVADPDICKQEKDAAQGTEQEKVTLGGKTPVDLNPSTDPITPKDLDDPATKKGSKKVNETFKDALKVAGKGTARLAGGVVAQGVGLPPRRTVRGVEKFISAWRKKKAGTSVATVGKTKKAGGKKPGGKKPGGGKPSGGKPGGGKPSGGIKATVATTTKRTARTSLSGTTSTITNKPAKKAIATANAGKKSPIKKVAPKTTANSIVGKEKGSTTQTVKRDRSLLSGAHKSSDEPFIRVDRKEFAKRLKASGGNLKKTTLSDEYATFQKLEALLEWQNRYEQPPPMSHHTADEHFEKMIDHHDHGLDAKERGDKTAARAHFRTRDKHFAHFVHKATDKELHKRKLNMHKVKAMLDIKEEVGPLTKIMSIYRRLQVT